MLQCHPSRESRRVRDHIPLKQGLRHPNEKANISINIKVRDHIPLKQGLRLTIFDNSLSNKSMSETIFP